MSYSSTTTQKQTGQLHWKVSQADSHNQTVMLGGKPTGMSRSSKQTNEQTHSESILSVTGFSLPLPTGNRAGFSSPNMEDD